MDPSRTLRGSPVVEAPGKVFLVGEYAVLDGAPAVLAAVSRYAVAQYLAELSPETPIIEETVKRAIAALGDLASAIPPGSVLVNTAGFRQRSSKLGLGSSAAAAVAAAGAVFEIAGQRLADNREELFAVADEAHRAAQGGIGSGADVAASVHGGFISFVRPPGGKPVITPLTPPDTLDLVVFWSGSPARTTDMIQTVRALGKSQPSTYARHMRRLRQISEGFVRAFTYRNAQGVIAQTDEYGRELEALGKSAGAPIVTPLFAEAADLARGLGGAAKPSGAGGGDVGIALFANAAAATEFAGRCRAGVSVLDVKVDGGGAKRRMPSTVQAL